MVVVPTVVGLAHRRTVEQTALPPDKSSEALKMRQMFEVDAN